MNIHKYPFLFTVIQDPMSQLSNLEAIDNTHRSQPSVTLSTCYDDLPYIVSYHNSSESN